MRSEVYRRAINIIMLHMNVGEWVTRHSLSKDCSTVYTNKALKRALDDMVEDGYLYRVDLSQFHKNCRQHIYQRTAKGFTITRNIEQLALNFSRVE